MAQQCKGFGDVLQHVIYETIPGVKSCLNCSQLKHKLNRMKLEEILQQKADIAKQLHDNATKYRWIAILAHINYVAFGYSKYETLIDRAITLYKQTKALS